MGSEKSGIMEAMVLGEKGNLGQENKLLFQIMGISHVLAISGTHLSILGWGLYKVLIKCHLPIKASGDLCSRCYGVLWRTDRKPGGSGAGSDHVWSFCRSSAGENVLMTFFLLFLWRQF